MPRVLGFRSRSGWQRVPDEVLKDGRFLVEPIMASLEAYTAYPTPSLTSLPVWDAMEGRSDAELRAAALFAAQLVAVSHTRGEQGFVALLGRRVGRSEWRLTDLAGRVASQLARRKLGWTVADADGAMAVALSAARSWRGPALASMAASVLERVVDGASVDRDEVAKLRDAIASNHPGETRVLERLRGQLPAQPSAAVDTRIVSKGDGWGREVIGLLRRVEDTTGINDLLSLLIGASNRPSASWYRRLAVAIDAAPAGQDLLAGMVEALLHHDLVPAGPYGALVMFTGTNADLARGAIHAWAHVDPAASVPVLAEVGLFSGTIPGGSAMTRDEKIANATAVALGAIGSDDAVAVLARLSQRIKNRNVHKQLDRALGEAAAKAGISRSELIERVVPTCGLGAGGRTPIELGDGRGELAIVGDKVRLQFFGRTGKVVASVPASVREAHPEELSALRQAAKEATKVLSSERVRLEGLLAADRSWRVDEWARLYRDHPVTGHWTRQLIWEFDGRAGWLKGNDVVDIDGAPVPFTNDSTVGLWHPIAQSLEAVEAWRNWLTDREVRQPFKQAWREVYLLTPAEEITDTYSNRFAAHILRYPQAYALMRTRQWATSALGYWDGGYDGTATRDFADGEWRAGFFFDLVENEADNYETPSLCATDQVRFERRGVAGWERVPLSDVPALVFSEAMRDVDLFVGVASIAADPTWNDRGEDRFRDYWRETGFGDLTASAESRRAALERLIPRTKIADRCRIDGRYLVVRGKRREYKIHIGSGNILMSPNDQYLCIVPARGRNDQIFLPFEEDGGRLSVIVSKAFLLADDDKITDRTILGQIGRR